jgi:hypothetical protein
MNYEPAATLWRRNHRIIGWVQSLQPPATGEGVREVRHFLKDFSRTLNPYETVAKIASEEV